ncbi:ras and Rab interactor 2 isoform X2 [Protopterus annectens]|uniref:ras and Rab interactor 2 isoform X2 n=1 Tax=Protopterus annectens TaxID=7888 RepID=UPI001CFBC3C9|nr:ras and Rab interactor 2 isoform X2 [Protopterus annectens]
MSTEMLETCRPDGKGSFFKLIDTIASEIGELKQEMVQPEFTPEHGTDFTDKLSLTKDMYSECLDNPDSQFYTRDSGYISLLNKLSVLDKVLHTHPVWLQLGLSDDEAAHVLQSQHPGAFLVRKSVKIQKKVLSLRLSNDYSPGIRDFGIKESQYTFSLEGSRISFADLFRLIAFYCISRDVLPFTLKLPAAILDATTEGELEDIADLGIEFWSSPTNYRSKTNLYSLGCVPSDSVGMVSGHLSAINGVHSLRTRTPSELECSQTNGALCFINPLFLEVHSQDISGNVKKQGSRNEESSNTGIPRSPPPRPPPPSLNSGLQLQDSKKEESIPERGILPKQGSLSMPVKKPAPIPPPRRPRAKTDSCREEVSNLRTSEEASSNYTSLPVTAENQGVAAKEQTLVSKGLTTNSVSVMQENGRGERLSNMSISTSSSDSLDFDRSGSLFNHEVDTNSSQEEIEEESDQESMAPPLKTKKRSSSFVIPQIVKTQFRKVSVVFSTFMTPEKRMVKKITELSRDKRTYFGCLVQDYISFLQENKECHVSSNDMLQTIRQFMTQVKNYLAQSSELDPPIESLIPEDQIDVVLEKAMHKCILKPLKSHIDAILREFHNTDNSAKQLRENLQLARQKTPQELGVTAPPPDVVTLEKIKHKFCMMQKMYSPEKKVLLLLRICKVIYTVMENNSGRKCGADDFLPMLTYVMAQCDMPEMNTEIEYMMELLDPSILHGEGGYYLTSAYGAMSLIKNFQEEQAARLLSSETRDTLRQWHKRRTTNRSMPSVDDFQNYLRVAYQEVNSGCTAKTLMVKPYTTTEDICNLCAEKFKVPDRGNYRLFLLLEDTWQQLTEDTHPQKIKAELHSRPQPQTFHFVYRRMENQNGAYNPEECNTVL